MATVDDLAARLAVLEARLGPMPAAAVPPIRIGELTDVPTPGSPIASAWSQEVTNRIRHRFPNVAARDTNWPAATAGNGAQCITLDTGTVWESTGTVWGPVARALKVVGIKNSGTCGTGLTDLLTVPVGVVAVATTLVCTAHVNFGFGQTINAAPDIWSATTGAVLVTVGAPYQAGAGALVGVPMAWSQSLAAGQTGDFKIRLNVTAMASGVCTWYVGGTAIAVAS